MKNRAFYAGSFDPFTLGHLELVKQASSIFSEVVIGIGINPNKERRYDKEKMKQAIEKTLEEENLFNCEVVIYDGFTYQAAKENKSNILLRGLRNEKDYLYEEEIAKFNDVYGINTIFLRTKDKADISSSFVYKELLNGKDITAYIPEPVKKLILK